MNTDKACEVLGLLASSSLGKPKRVAALTPLKEACNFAIIRMREFDSLQKMLRSIVAEFKEEQGK